MRREHLEEALLVLGFDEGDFRFEGVGREWWPTEGHYVTEQDGQWVGGWTERGQRTPLVQPSDGDAAASWLFAQLTNSLASDHKSAELCWTKQGLQSAGQRMTQMTAPIRAAAARNAQAHARVTLRPGYVLDQVDESGTLVFLGAARHVGIRRHLLVLEPLAADLSVLAHDEDPARVIVQVLAAAVDSGVTIDVLVQDRVLQHISVDEERP